MQRSWEDKSQRATHYRPVCRTPAYSVATKLTVQKIERGYRRLFAFTDGRLQGGQGCVACSPEEVGTETMVPTRVVAPLQIASRSRGMWESRKVVRMAPHVIRPI
ncbi:hypothetical protein Rcae01_01148 [Novipirellula caenicola]|uniref:Uncharacterized protein n=1 Tax=Novipirellula caenicola TaxID=1536901 RepID=A0ABP9VPP5_9BACT